MFLGRNKFHATDDCIRTAICGMSYGLSMCTSQHGILYGPVEVWMTVSFAEAEPQMSGEKTKHC